MVTDNRSLFTPNPLSCPSAELTSASQLKMLASPKANAFTGQQKMPTVPITQHIVVVVAVYLTSPRRYCAYVPPFFTLHHTVTEHPVSNNTRTISNRAFSARFLGSNNGWSTNELLLDGHGATNIAHLKVFPSPLKLRSGPAIKMCQTHACSQPVSSSFTITHTPTLIPPQYATVLASMGYSHDPSQPKRQKMAPDSKEINQQGHR